MVYKLYSADLRRHVEVRSPYLEAANESIEYLKSTNSWKHRPSIITDQDGRIIDNNQIDVAH
jgi:hypothetical protein